MELEKLRERAERVFEEEYRKAIEAGKDWRTARKIAKRKMEEFLAAYGLTSRHLSDLLSAPEATLEELAGW